MSYNGNFNIKKQATTTDILVRNKDDVLNHLNRKITIISLIENP